MEQDELRAIQAPAEGALRGRAGGGPGHPLGEREPGRGHLLLGDTGRAIAEAGLHPASGGDGTLLCSGDMLLEALAACAGVTLRAVATSLGIPVGSGTVRAEGDLDFRGTLAVDREAPVGFRAIRLSFELDDRGDRGGAGDPAEADRALLRRPADAGRLARAVGQRQNRLTSNRETGFEPAPARPPAGRWECHLRPGASPSVPASPALTASGSLDDAFGTRSGTAKQNLPIPSVA